ncbi:MAG: AAA family ATPase [Candidatus Binatus sp.]
MRRLAHFNRRSCRCRENDHCRSDPRVCGRARLCRARICADDARGKVAFGGGSFARTVANLLEGQSPETQTKQIWIVDESSLLPTRQVNRLFHKAAEGRVERIIFVGDQRQHHAIEAGQPIHQMQEAGMLVARLDTIRRQRDPELREAVTLASKGEIAQSLVILERRGDIREVEDTQQRRKQIAREYTAAHQLGERVLVVSPANDERRELNKAIREDLISHGLVAAAGHEHTILVDRGLSGVQRAIAYNYEEGDVIRFTRGSKQSAIPKDGYARVESVDREANLLAVATPDGRRIQYNPTRLFGVEVFREEQRTIAQGERIQFRAPDRALGVANGEFATIKSIDAQRALMRLDNDKEIIAALDRLRHIDHGYASTSHSAQGATVDRIIVNVDTRLSSVLVNNKQFYVSISRARNSISIYTDDRHSLWDVVNRTREKSIALERSSALSHRSFAVLLEQHRSISRGHSLRR